MLSRNTISSSSHKNSYEQSIYTNIKRDKEIRKSGTGQYEDNTTWCWLNYDYIKNHYRLISIDLSGEKELDNDPKTIQQKDFLGN